LSFKINKKQLDLLIIGAGGAGMMSAISCFDSGAKNIAVISKVFPTNSHSVSAKGGINAALGNSHQDDWRWHLYDTLKGADGLADYDAANILCKNAKSAILDLEAMGLVFSRDESGKISQRAYGGQTKNFGRGGIAKRACYAKDKTGQTMLYSLYEQANQRGIKFFSEFFVTDLLIDKSRCLGAVAFDINLGEITIFESKALILATGGYSQIYRNTTSSLICTGDGSALVFKEGLPLQDMEFVQFHPTGIYGQGFLVTEAARGEGGFLLNSLGERFMKNYDENMMELASRDVVSRAMATEIVSGRGCGEEQNYLHLDLRHLSSEALNSKLPGVIELAKNFAKIDVKKSLIPVVPTAHYTMGGIPTNIDCNVIDENGIEISGLMSVGESACLSVHGANRLGCNSLLDLIVFGKIAGITSAKKILENKLCEDAKAAEKVADEKIIKLQNLLQKKDLKNTFSLNEIKNNLQNSNEKYLGVFRNKELMEAGFTTVNALFSDFKSYEIKNKNLIWNDELIFYFELENLFLNSFATIFSAMSRLESRGSHYRSDYKNHDKNPYHSLVKKNGDSFSLYKNNVRQGNSTSNIDY
jgi:succinate dehydrogenase / fumarate reductase flavoprotein subunit